MRETCRSWTTLLSSGRETFFCRWSDALSCYAYQGYVFLLRQRSPRDLVLSSALAAAAEGGSREAVLFLREAGCPWNSSVTAAAARGEHLDLLIWLVQEAKCTWNAGDLGAGAARGKSLRCLKWVVETLCHGTMEPCCSVLEAAAEAGSFKCLKYASMGLSFDRYGLNGDGIILAAVSADSVECLQFCLKNGCQVTTEVMKSAIQSGATSCLDHLLRAGFCKPRWDVLCALAASSCDPGSLVCLRNRGCRFDSWTCWHAATNGSLPCLRYLHESGCQWAANTCSGAAGGGHLDCLEYAHTHGCPWTASTCEAAARSDSLDCLAYAHENGCSWDHAVWSAAQKCPNSACLAYLVQNDCPRTIP